MALMAACGSATIGTPDALQPADLTITVLVRDYSGLSGAELQGVASETRLSLSRAGIQVQWIFCGGARVTSESVACRSNLTPGRFLVRILARHPGDHNKSSEPLGAAEIESFYASLYAGEIRAAAISQGVPFAGVMAHVAVHEIGHLLLGPRHSLAGIMQACWGRNAYRSIAQRGLGYSPVERDALQMAVRHNSAGEIPGQDETDPPPVP